LHGVSQTFQVVNFMIHRNACETYLLHQALSVGYRSRITCH